MTDPKFNCWVGAGEGKETGNRKRIFQSEREREKKGKGIINTKERGERKERSQKKGGSENRKRKGGGKENQLLLSSA